MGNNNSTQSYKMASRTFSRALRSPLAKQLSAPARRTFVSALNASARPTAARAAVASAQQVRGVKTIDFAGVKEDVYERADWPPAKLQEFFKNDTMAIIGYGSQGHAQSLNMRDQGLNVVVGVRKNGQSWMDAQQDGWVPGKTLFEVDEAITKGKTLYFSHGFSPVFKDQTKVDVPTDVDVILVAPKGSGRTVRTLFREGRGINSSIAVFQDVTGKAKEKAIALGV